MIVALGPSSNKIIGFDIDTAHFTGNYGPEASVWGLKLDGDEKSLEKEESKLDGDDSRVRFFSLLYFIPRFLFHRNIPITVTDRDTCYLSLKRCNSGNSSYPSSRSVQTRDIYSNSISQRRRFTRM